MMQIASFFTSLDKGYDQHSNNVHRLYLTTSAWTKEPSFITYTSWIRRVVASIFGRSFDLTRASSIIYQNAQKFLYSESYDAIENTPNLIRTILKVLQSTHTILQYAANKKALYGRCSKSLHIELKMYSKLIEQNIQELARRENRQAVEVALSYNMPFIAMNLVRQGHSCFGIDPRLLQSLVPLCIQQQEKTLFLEIIALGVDISHETNLPFLDLAFTAVTTYNESALISLFHHSHFPLEEVKTANNISLICTAAKNGMEESVKILIEKCHFSVGTCSDKDGNSLLHYGLLSCNMSLVHYLLTKIENFEIKNKRGTDPFTYFLEYEGIPENIKKTFLQSVFSNSYRPELHSLTKSFSFSNNGYNIHPIEYILVTSNFKLINKLRHIYSREDFEKACSILTTWYRPEAVQQLFLNLFYIDPQQYNIELDNYTAGPAPEGSCLSYFEEIFDTINYSDPKSTTSTYINPQELFSLSGKDSLDQIRSLLVLLLNRVRTQQVYLGTPSSGESLTLFYEQIELHLKHVAHVLRQKNDPYLSASVIKELIAAAPKCGGRYYSVALEQYLRICHKVVETFIKKTVSSLAQYKGFMFHNAVIDFSSSEVHNHNRALRLIGNKYTIPGYKEAQFFDDYYIGERFNITHIENGFLSYMTASGIILDWFLPLIKTDADFREAYIDWHTNEIPKWWEEEKIGNLKQKIQHITNSSVGSEKQKIAVKELLLQYHIDYSDHIDPFIAIQRYITDLYLEEFVHTNYEISINGIIYWLERLGIIKSVVPYKQSSKKVTAIILRNETFYIKIAKNINFIKDYVSSVFDTILDL